RARAPRELAGRPAPGAPPLPAPQPPTDPPSALPRLLDMGAEPFLIASSLLGALAQRLVRRVCAACGGSGCAPCRGTGFRGRTGIHELLVIDDEARALVMRRGDATALRRHATAAGMTTLREDGFAKARARITTEPEVVRVTERPETASRGGTE